MDEEQGLPTGADGGLASASACGRPGVGGADRTDAATTRVDAAETGPEGAQPADEAEEISRPVHDLLDAYRGAIVDLLNAAAAARPTEP